MSEKVKQKTTKKEGILLILMSVFKTKFLIFLTGVFVLLIAYEMGFIKTVYYQNERVVVPAIYDESCNKFIDELLERTSLRNSYPNAKTIKGPFWEDIYPNERIPMRTGRIDGKYDKCITSPAVMGLVDCKLYNQYSLEESTCSYPTVVKYKINLIRVMILVFGFILTLQFIKQKKEQEVI